MKGIIMDKKLKENEFLEKRIEEFNRYVRECLVFGSMESFDEQAENLKTYLQSQIDRIKKGE